MGNTQSEQRKHKALAVVTGDVHYDLHNLELADKGSRMVIAKANELDVPAVFNGDTHTTKANLRGECVNAMIETFKTAKIKPYVNIGNHCRINSRSKEHSLNFLAPYAHIIDEPTYVKELGAYIIPYYEDLEPLIHFLDTLPMNALIFMHQGVTGALPGEYSHDKTAINAAHLSNFRTILSHYHARQDIKCGGARRKPLTGIASFIGNLYTTNFGEANDPEKGFQILMDDGTLEFVPTNLRKHVVIDLNLDHIDYVNSFIIPKLGDLVWVKLRGPKERLFVYDKKAVSKTFNLSGFDFHLDLIPTDSEIQTPQAKNLTQGEILDAIIDSTEASDERKARLKELWRKSSCL